VWLTACKCNEETRDMTWKAPKIVEFALGAEINAYACAES
jgi:coenzyme PQQ precursor peptide PqqA